MDCSSGWIMKPVLLDFNGTLFFDTCFHLEAWSKIYKEFHPDAYEVPERAFFCGPRNDDIIYTIAPDLTELKRQQWSERKEELYRTICRENPDKLHLVKGAEDFLQYLKEHNYPFILASASIKANIDFYFDTFRLERWFDKETCVFDNGLYKNKGEMHVEAAKRLGYGISECLVVEDSLNAIMHSKSYGAGMILAIGDKDMCSELKHAGADYCIEDFTEFDYGWLNI